MSVAITERTGVPVAVFSETLAVNTSAEKVGLLSFTSDICIMNSEVECRLGSPLSFTVTITVKLSPNTPSLSNWVVTLKQNDVVSKLRKEETAPLNVSVNIPFASPSPSIIGTQTIPSITTFSGTITGDVISIMGVMSLMLITCTSMIAVCSSSPFVATTTSW